MPGCRIWAIDRAKEIVEQLTDNDITEKIQNIAVDTKGEGRAKKQQHLDEVDLAQMSLFDTVTDEDVIKELMELEIECHVAAGCPECFV